MKNMNALGLIRICVVSLAAAVALTACDEEVVPEKSMVRPVRAMKVDDAASFQRRTFSGRAKATRELDLAFNVAGPLVQYRVKVGDEVAKGDLLARINPATFQAEAKRAQAALGRARATKKNSKLQLDRDRTLFEKGHVAQARLDRSIARNDETAADVEAAEAILQKAQLDLEYTNLRAPFGSIVVQTYVENFENVQAKQQVIRLVDASRIEMVVDIPEGLISLAPRARNIAVTFDTFPDVEIPARIREIGTEASETTRTYPVTLIMDQPAGAKILPGMAGKAYSKSPPAEDLVAAGLEIPISALLTDAADGKTYVWVIDDQSNTVKKREVSSGALTDRGIRISNGLKPGEWIATAGVNYLRDGQNVRILAQ